MTVDLSAQVHEYLTTAPGSLFVQREVELIHHWQGDANLLWRVRCGNEDAVVKLFLDAGQARSRRQHDAQSMFAPLGLSPTPLWWDRYPQGLSRQLIAYRWADGIAVAPHDAGDLDAWADAVAAVHAAPPDEVRRFSPHPYSLDYYWRIEQGSIAQIEEWLRPSGLALRSVFRSVAASTTSFVEANLPLWASAAPTPVHGDLSLDHSLLNRGRVILLDWEMFGLGDPSLDVARLLQREALSLKPQQVEQWLDRYLDMAGDRSAAQRISVYRQLLNVHHVVLLLLGLQQHTVGPLDDELIAALPFVQETVAATLDAAISAMGAATNADAAQVAHEFIAWLQDATQIAR